MKKILFLIMAISFLPACALTIEETTSYDYLRNHGHSEVLIDAVYHQKTTIDGEKYISMDEQKHQNDFFLVKWIRKFFMYADPALDSGTFYDHNIKITPQVNDL